MPDHERVGFFLAISSFLAVSLRRRYCRRCFLWRRRCKGISQQSRLGLPIERLEIRVDEAIQFGLARGQPGEICGGRRRACRLFGRVFAWFVGELLIIDQDFFQMVDAIEIRCIGLNHGSST